MPLPDMINICSGRVNLSDRRTQRSWKVEVEGLQMARTPVTHQWWAQVTGSAPSTSVGALLPVEGVSWTDAVRFCNAASTAEGLGPAYHSVGDEHDQPEPFGGTPR